MYALNESGNLTDVDNKEIYELPNVFRWTLLSVYILIIIVSIGGNCLVCFVIGRFLKFRTVTNFFIVSLAITDINMTCFCVPFTITSNLVFYYWPFGDFLCPFVSYIQIMSVLQRSFTLVCLTCDRYLVVLRPMRKRLTKPKAKMTILCVWIIAAIGSIPTALRSRIEYLPYEPGSNGLCLEIWQKTYHRNVYGIILMVLQYFLPLLLMTFTYVHICIIIAKRPPGEACSVRDQRLALSKRKTIKVAVAVVIAYALSWLPLHVLTLIGDLKPEIFDIHSVHMVWLVSHCLAFSNSGINPIIYYWISSKFRQGYTNVFQLCCRPSSDAQTLNIYKEYMQMSSYRGSTFSTVKQMDGDKCIKRQITVSMHLSPNHFPVR